MFRKLALLAVLLTLVTIALGAYVRVMGAGLGCPDWPGCYGKLVIDQEQTSVPPFASGRAFDAALVGFNIAAHRYLGGIVAVAILIMSVSVWKLPKDRFLITFLTMASMSMVILQTLVGIWALEYKLLPLAVTGHLMLGFVLLALLYWLYLAATAGGIKPFAAGAGIRWLARLGLLALLIQLAIGGWTSANYAGLACPDFPTCQGKLWPNIDYREAFALWRGLSPNFGEGILPPPARVAVHWTHRLVVFVVSVVLMVLAIMISLKRQFANLRKAGILMIFLLFIEISLGIAAVLLRLPAAVVVAHTVTAALLLLNVVYVNLHFAGVQTLARRNSDRA